MEGKGDDNKQAEGQEAKIRVTDRRFWVVDEKAVENAQEPKRKFPSFVEHLKARTETAEQKLKERLQELEQENEAYRDRQAREAERRLAKEKERLIGRFLEILDNLERTLQAVEAGGGLESLSKGVALSLELFRKQLQSEGVEELDVLQREFDPHQAEAMGYAAVDDPQLDQKVVEVLQPGYRIGETLLRPARVRIGQFRE